MEDVYFSAYCRLDNTSGDSTVDLDGNVVGIGRDLDVVPDLQITERGKEVFRVIIKQGDITLGFLPKNTGERVRERLDEGWVCHVYPTYVVYDKETEGFWCEVAVVCYDPAHADALDAFSAHLAKRFAAGDHPAIDLTPEELSTLVESGGAQLPTRTKALPKLSKKSAYYKTKQTTAEKAATAAASGNKGCYVALVAVTLLVVALIVCFFLFR